MLSKYIMMEKRGDYGSGLERSICLRDLLLLLFLVVVVRRKGNRSMFYIDGKELEDMVV